MKKLFNLVLLTSITLLFSCAENEQPKEEEPSPVVGEWQIEEITIEGTITETKNGQTITGRYSGTAQSDENNKIIFKDDNTFTREDSYSLMIHTFYPPDGKSTHDLHTFPYLPIEGTYQIEGNTITLIPNQTNHIYGPLDPRDSFEGTIMELTANRMVIVEEHQEISNVDGVEIVKEHEMTQVFTR